VALTQAGDWPVVISPRVVPLPESIEHSWTCALPRDDVRLAPIAGKLWLTVADGRLFELRRQDPPGIDLGAEADARLPPGGFRPSYGSDPIYVTDTGDVGRSGQKAGWRPVWSADVPGRAIDAFGLPGGRVLLSSSEWPDGTRLLDERLAAIVWSRAGMFPRMLAAEELGLGWRAGQLSAIALTDGELLWSREGVLDVAALSQDAAWLADESGVLIEVAARSGALSAETELPGGVPSFALAPEGLLYVVGRPLEALVVDLLDGTRLVARRKYPEGILSGVPHVLAPAPDSRVVVSTANSLLELRPERDDEVRELWRTDDLIVDAEAAGSQIGVLTMDDSSRRFLTLLGAES
jgi:hypothetical protein